MPAGRTWGAFSNTDLDADLKQQGVTQLVIASIGVESTARLNSITRVNPPG